MIWMFWINQVEAPWVKHCYAYQKDAETLRYIIPRLILSELYFVKSVTVISIITNAININEEI